MGGGWRCAGFGVITGELHGRKSVLEEIKALCGFGVKTGGDISRVNCIYDENTEQSFASF